MKHWSCVVAVILCGTAKALTVSSDFEGGSCRVLKVEEAAQLVEVMPAGDPQRGWPCWWYFRVNDCKPGMELTVLLHGSDVPMPRDEKHQPLPAYWAMPQQAFISPDGEQWSRTAPGQLDKGVMRYVVKPKGNSVYVAWGPAFTPSKAGALVKEMAAAHSAFAKAETLCQSREGRPVQMLHVMDGDTPMGKRPVVWLEARQHAWESGSSWVAQGCMKWLVGDDPAAARLRRQAEIFCIPIMDIDNTATGNGGKDALPQDHNRDWSEKPHWNEVVAAQNRIREFIQQDRMAVFLDLHNPGPGDKKAFFYVLPEDIVKPAMLAARNDFIARAAANIGKVYPMQTQPKYDGPKYHPLWKQMSGTWVSLNGNAETVGICLETAWDVPECSTENYQKVGAALASTVAEFLQRN